MLPAAALSQEAVWRSEAPLQLSLRRAVELALSPEGNPHIQLAQEAVKQAQARSAQARGALLPDLAGSFGLAKYDPQPVGGKAWTRDFQLPGRNRSATLCRSFPCHGCAGNRQAERFRPQHHPPLPILEGGGAGHHEPKATASMIRLRCHRAGDHSQKPGIHVAEVFAV